MWNPWSSQDRAGKSAPRRRLLRDPLLLVAVTSGSLLAAVFYAGETLRDDLATEQLRESLSLSASRFATSPVFDAVQAWQTAGAPAHTPRPFEHRGTWWTWMQPLNPRPGSLRLGSTLPEVDFVGALWRLVLLVGVLAGLILTLALTRHYGRHLQALLHVKNLLNQHIGAEFSKHIEAQVRGQTMMVVVCEKADESVFLMIGKNDEFHIRSGPSSMKLLPRQLVQYLKLS